MTPTHRNHTQDNPDLYLLTINSGVVLSCGIHACPSKCHQLHDHSKMLCHSVMNTKCSNGHLQSYMCHQNKPLSCRACEKQAKDLARQAQLDHERQQRQETAHRIHDAEMAKFDEELLQIREARADRQRSAELAIIIEQKKTDLELARSLSQIRLGPPTVLEKVAKTSGDTKVQNTVATKQKAAITIQNLRVGTVQSSDLVKEKDPSHSEQEWNRQKRTENASNPAIDDLMAMTGLEDVKSQVLRIKARIETSVRQGTNMKKERFGVVLLGNPGTGKTTVARIYARFLTSVGILPGSEFFETSGSKLANEGVAEARKHVENMIKAGGGAFFLDEAYQLTEKHNAGGKSVLDYLLAEIENQAGKIVFILAGYNKQMESFFEHNPGYSSRIPYRLQFTDYSDKELLDMFVAMIKKKYSQKMIVDDGAAGLYSRIVIRRLGRGRGREGFGNARSLENILANVSERQADRLQQERVAGNQPDDFFLTKEDLIGPEPTGAVANSQAWKKIQSLIGLQSVKSSIQSMIDRIGTNYLRELQENDPVQVSLNKVFLGSPGTGKTSVGKLYGQALVDLGLLSSGEGSSGDIL